MNRWQAQCKYVLGPRVYVISIHSGVTLRHIWHAWIPTHPLNRTRIQIDNSNTDNTDWHSVMISNQSHTLTQWARAYTTIRHVSLQNTTQWHSIHSNTIETLNYDSLTNSTHTPFVIIATPPERIIYLLLNHVIYELISWLDSRLNKFPVIGFVNTSAIMLSVGIQTHLTMCSRTACSTNRLRTSKCFIFER